MRRVGIIVVTLLAALAAVPAAGAAGGSFSDDDGSVHEVDIETLFAAGITKGCGPGVYCPDDPITRGQMAAFLHRSGEIDLPATTSPSFVDVDGHLFESDIAWLAERGITKGCNPPANDRFCPDDPVTRGQMAAFLVRALELGTAADPFIDDDGSVFAADIASLAGAGITKGCNPPANDRFCPEDLVTRGQMASFLVRAFGLTVPPTARPLVDAGDITYLGAFALPGGTYGSSRFGYGGRALSVFGDTLFVGGHAWDAGSLAQVSIPPTLGTGDWATLPEATVLQPFADVTDGSFDSGWTLYGTMPWSDRLIVAASIYYDAAGNQATSHAASSLDLSESGDFTGFEAIDAAAPPRSQGGYMTAIPVEWQSLLGGPALTGQCCIPIISATSSGPAATVFDPDDIGADPSGTTLLWYPLEHEIADGTSQNDTFNLATEVVGVAFPTGSRSVLFVGRHGTGPYCYGIGTDDPSLHGNPTGEGSIYCYDPVDSSKGTHSYPYRHQVWAYDAAELVAVVNGDIEPWEPRPYAVWELEGIVDDGTATAVGAAYDPATGRLYMTDAYGEQPQVHVFQITP
jgi:hypothetical protein